MKGMDGTNDRRGAYLPCVFEWLLTDCPPSKFVNAVTEDRLPCRCFVCPKQRLDVPRFCAIPVVDHLMKSTGQLRGSDVVATS